MKRIVLLTTIGAVIGLTAPYAFADGPSVPRLDPPVIVPPFAPEPSFAGFYAGLSYMGTTSTERGVRERSETTQEQWEEPIYDNCTYDGAHSGGKKCTFDEGVDLAELFPGIAPCQGYSKTCDMGGNRAFIKGASGSFYTYETGETETVYGEEIVTFFEEAFKAISEDGQAGGFVGYRYDLGSVLVGAEAGSDGTMHTLEAQAGLQLSSLFAYGFAGIGKYDDQEGTTYGAGVDMMLSTKVMVGAQYRVGEFGAIDTESYGVRIAYKF